MNGGGVNLLKEINYAELKNAYFTAHTLKPENASDVYKWKTEEDGEKKVMKDWKEKMKPILNDKNHKNH
jgi:hypothetical protein